ncbi:hypothetical protein N7501_010931 [Penicillium viridicatum]|nr:hypothetical protein N7501_010931 [Penicillium viridicatum]
MARTLAAGAPVLGLSANNRDLVLLVDLAALPKQKTTSLKIKHIPEYGYPALAMMPQENGAEMPMAMSDDQDPTSFLSSTAVDLPRYLGLASLPTDPSLQIAISPPHGVHGTSFNWETSLLGDFSDAQLKNPATFYQPQGVINAVHPATSTPVSASAPVSADGASLFEFDPDDISGDREYSHGHWLKQLGDLNVAIYRHPLHPKPASGNMPGVSASFSTQPVSLSSLQIGQLLHMTSQLGRLTKEIDPADHLQPTYEGSAESDSFGEIKLAMHDRSTLFVVLGCYRWVR